ncbi:MAG: ABC transporter permease, partial [Lachnospiraceae bacterium]|nr:ABC transporter permease [Lachnospiraceae bacterium]
FFQGFQVLFLTFNCQTPVIQMLANVGGDAEKAKYITFFTLFDPDGIIAGESSAIVGVFVLLAGAVILYALGIMIFERKDLHI